MHACISLLGEVVRINICRKNAKETKDKVPSTKATVDPMGILKLE